MEFTIIDEDGDQNHYEPPSYGIPGRLLIRVYDTNEEPSDGINWEYTVIDYDGDSSIFWLNEHGMFDWYLEDIDFTEPGAYYFEKVVGYYTKGDWGFTEDEEEWKFSDPIRVPWKTGSLEECNITS